MSGWLVVVDFDGTASETDVLDWICTRHAPEATAAAEAALLRGEIGLDECIRREFEGIRGDHDALVAEAVEVCILRRGFVDFVRAARAGGHRLVVVSSGFRCVIEAAFERAGLGEVELVSNDIRFSPDGSTVVFRDGELCTACGERCKRPVVAALDGGRPVAYVGDGYSDRCAAEAADRRFACDSLARHLERNGLEYQPFDDFHQIADVLF